MAFDYSKDQSNRLRGSTGKMEDAPLIQTRLFESGLFDFTDYFDFVEDIYTPKILEGFDKENKDEYSTSDTTTSNIGVKTGIWQVTYEGNSDYPKGVSYIVTAVSMDDRVDRRKLRRKIRSEQTFANRSPKLSYAPIEVAEKLAGYQSGSMAPICHLVDMKLYLEESLVTDGNLDTKSFCVGSGVFGQCLCIPVKKFLQVAKSNPKGLEACSIIQKRRVNSPLVNKEDNI